MKFHNFYYDGNEHSDTKTWQLFAFELQLLKAFCAATVLFKLKPEAKYPRPSFLLPHASAAH